MSLPTASMSVGVASVPVRSATSSQRSLVTVASVYWCDMLAVKTHTPDVVLHQRTRWSSASPSPARKAAPAARVSVAEPWLPHRHVPVEAPPANSSLQAAERPLGGLFTS